MPKNTQIRLATEGDMTAIHQLVYELAVYEKEQEAVKTTVAYYRDSFKHGLFQCLVAEVNQKIEGIALYYPRFSTWKGKMMHLEDFVVRENVRGLGIGRLLFDEFITQSKKQDCVMVVWDVLNWNEPAINFYKKYNTVFDNEWSMCKIYF